MGLRAGKELVNFSDQDVVSTGQCVGHVQVVAFGGFSDRRVLC